MRVLHVPAKVDAEVTPILSKHISDFAPHSSVVLVATAQHLQELDCAKKFLESNGKKVFVGGQVLGCDPKPALLLSKKADCFICIGSGRFHPLAIALETDKPVYIANPLSKTFEAISEEEKRRWIGRKKGRLAKAAAAETFGILVSTKTDQFRIKEAPVDGQEGAPLFRRLTLARKPAAF